MADILSYAAANSMYKRYLEFFGDVESFHDIGRPLYKNVMQGMASHRLDKQSIFHRNGFQWGCDLLDKSADFSGLTAEADVSNYNFTSIFGGEISDGTATPEEFDKILDKSPFIRLQSDIDRLGQIVFNAYGRETINGCAGLSTYLSKDDDQTYSDYSKAFSGKAWGEFIDYGEGYGFHVYPEISYSRSARNEPHYSYTKKRTELSAISISIPISVDSMSTICRYLIEGDISDTYTAKWYSVVVPMTQTGDNIYTIPSSYTSADYLESLATDLGFTIPPDAYGPDMSLYASLARFYTFVAKF